MRPWQKLSVVLALVAVAVTVLAGGCKDSKTWRSMAVGVVMATIIEPAVADGWTYILAALEPLGVVNADGTITIGQDNIVEFLYTLIPACDTANTAVRVQKSTAAEAARKARTTRVRAVSAR